MDANQQALSELRKDVERLEARTHASKVLESPGAVYVVAMRRHTVPLSVIE
jgi:hypothetical protein